MVQLTPEAQAIIDKNRAKKAKKELGSKAPAKKTKAEVDASLATAPRKPGESMYHGHGEQFSNEAFFGELGDTLAVMGSGATAGAGPWAIEKLSGYPARQKVLEAKERLGSTDAAASEVFGAVVPAVVGPGLATVAAKTPGLLGGAARTGLSALEGAGYGATSAATDLDETTSPGQAAAVGGAFGVGGQLLGEGAGAAWNWLRSFGTRGAAEQAAQTVANAAAKNPEAAQQLAELGPEGMVGDVLGQPGQRIIRGAADRDPVAQQMMEQQFGQRLGRQKQNIVSAVEEAADIAPEHRLTPKQLAKEARENRRPGIDRAYQSATQAGKQLEREQRVRSRFVQDEPGTAVLEEGASNVTPPRGRIVDELVDTETPRFFGDLLQTPGGREAWAHAKTKLANMKPTHGEDVGGDFWMLNEAQKFLSNRAAGANKKGRETGDWSEAEIWGPLAKGFAARMDGLLDLPQYTEAKKLHAAMKEEVAAIERGAKLAEPGYPATLPREAIATREGPRGPLLGAAQAQGYGHTKAAQLRKSPTLGKDINSFRSQVSQEGAAAALGERASIVEEAVRRADVFKDTATSVSGGSGTSRNLNSQFTEWAMKNLTAPALAGGATLAYGLGTGDFDAYKTTGALLTAWAAQKGLNAAQTAKLQKMLPEIARIMTSQTIPEVAPRIAPTLLGRVGGRAGGLLGAQ